MKEEQIKTWREKTKLQQESKEFIKWKDMVDEHYKQQKTELEKDYNFIEG